jgi:hypothetical protein
LETATDDLTGAGTGLVVLAESRDVFRRARGRRREPAQGAVTPDRSASTTLRGALVSLATVVVVIGLVIAAFFNPFWIGFEQERVGAPAITGYTPDQVHAVTGSILADLFVGPPEFGAAVNG